jgi:hypothetical protein
MTAMRSETSAKLRFTIDLDAMWRLAWADGPARDPTHDMPLEMLLAEVARGYLRVGVMPWKRIGNG